jgi:phytoene dehydrogenase-like protein
VRDPRMTGLYFAGGAIHPGSGVPIEVVSGRLAAREMPAQDLRNPLSGAS